MDTGLKPSQLLVPLGAHPAAALGPDNGNKHRKKIAGCLEGGTTGGRGGRSSPIKRPLWWRHPAGLGRAGGWSGVVVCYLRAHSLLTTAVCSVKIQYNAEIREFLSLFFFFQCFSVLKPCLKALWKTTNLLFIQTWILSVCIIGFLKSQCLIVCPSGRTERVNPESQTLQPNHQAFGAEVHPLPSSGWVQKAQPNTSRHGQGLIKPSPLLKRSLHWIN